MSLLILNGNIKKNYFYQLFERGISYDFKNLSMIRISIPLTRSKILSLVRKAVAPQRKAVASWIAS